MRHLFSIVLVAAATEGMAPSAKQVRTATILLPLVALVWASVAVSLFGPSPAPNRNPDQIQDTLAANVVYVLP